MIRYLTANEMSKKNKLVKSMCANYFYEYKICLPRDKACPVLRLKTTGGLMCDYFKNGVLPLDKELEHILLGGSSGDLKECEICKKKFIPNGRQKYCSDDCKQEAKKKSTAKSMVKYRQNRKG